MGEYFLSLSSEMQSYYMKKIQIINNFDPYTLWKSDFIVRIEDIPKFSIIDIISYFIFTHSFYTKTQFNAYKSLDAYKIVEAGFILKIICAKVNEYYVVLGEVIIYIILYLPFLFKQIENIIMK